MLPLLSSRLVIVGQMSLDSAKKERRVLSISSLYCMFIIAQPHRLQNATGYAACIKNPK